MLRTLRVARSPSSPWPRKLTPASARPDRDRHPRAGAAERDRRVTKADALAAIAATREDAVQEGAVSAGTGTIALGKLLGRYLLKDAGEAVLNSMFKAESMDGHNSRIEALPVDRVLELHRKGRAR